MSADVLKLQENMKRAEVKLEQMTSERDTLLERLKVSLGVMFLFSFDEQNIILNKTINH